MLWRDCLLILSVTFYALLSASCAVGQTFVTLDDPLGSGGTILSGIDGSTIVGSYVDSAGASHGLVFNGASSTTLDDPAAQNAAPFQTGE
jgi:hypothetical protein